MASQVVPVSMKIVAPSPIRVFTLRAMISLGFRIFHTARAINERVDRHGKRCATM